jgi:uncharacterized damage-inducible protein DinB
MTPTGNSASGAKPALQGPREQLLDGFEREHATTMRVLRAYPIDELDLKPHAKCKTARELAWTFVVEQSLAEKALTTGLDWSKPSPMPPPPASMDAVLAALDEGHKRVVNLVGNMREDQLFGTVKFPTAPKTIGDVPIVQFLGMLLSDQIHHRGQFSIYLRMADGKLPSIYGPTADEPWM